MTLTQLKAFVAVATTGSVRAAAERLFVSQPAVSAAVTALQRELEVPLITRQGRGIQLTPSGRVFAATPVSSSVCSRRPPRPRWGSSIPSEAGSGWRR